MRWTGILAVVAVLTLTGCPEPDYGESVRMGTFNVQFLPGSDDDTTRPKRIADRIKAGQYDIIALNEVFDEEARETFVAELRDSFPSYVEYIGDPAVGAQDSGLMLFSRFPFEPLPDAVHRARPGLSQGPQRLPGTRQRPAGSDRNSTGADRRSAGTVDRPAGVGGRPAGIGEGAARSRSASIGALHEQSRLLQDL